MTAASAFWAFSILSPLALSALFYFVVLRRNREVYRKADYHQVFLAMAILFICIVLNSLRSMESQGLVYTNVYDLLCCGCYLLLQFSMSFSAKMLEENKTLELLINQQHEQHKLSNQPFLRTLEIYDTVANTGNATLDAVLMEKGLMCEMNQIRFSFIVDGKQLAFMEIADLFSLVSNILDNAIESERKEPEEERRMINLRIVRSHDMILLDAENYCRYPVEVRDNMIQTTKSDKENHGLGMRGIDYVVKKYGGERRLSQEDNFFRVSIVFPARE